MMTPLEIAAYLFFPASAVVVTLILRRVTRGDEQRHAHDRK
jgi:hypothetical protein